MTDYIREKLLSANSAAITTCLCCNLNAGVAPAATDLCSHWPILLAVVSFPFLPFKQGKESTVAIIDLWP